MDYEQCIHWKVCSKICPPDLRDCVHYLDSSIIINEKGGKDEINNVMCNS